MKNNPKFLFFLIFLIFFGFIFGAKIKARQDKENPKKDIEFLKQLSGKIVFQSNKTGNNEIYLMDVCGKNLRQLTNNSACDEMPAFSPDGEKIVFVSDRSGENQLYIMDLNGKNLTKLETQISDAADPAWSTDNKIYFSAKVSNNEDIYVYDLGSQKTQRLTFEKSREILPAISPSGKILLITRNTGFGWQIWKMPAQGGKMEKLTSFSGNCRPDWSPDERKIAFVSMRADKKGDIFLMNSDGSEQVRVTNDNLNHDYDPSFSSCGKKIVFTKTLNKEKSPWSIWIYDLENKKEYILFADSAKNKFPDWSK